MKQKDSAGKLLILGIQHVFAMFGATVLVPILTGLDPLVALFCAGVGTWIFHLVTGRKVPVFLGSSFAFIAAIIAVGKIGLSPEEIAAAEAAGESITGLTGYQAMMPYAMGGIIVAGGIYLILALLVKLLGTNFITKMFPPIVTGPIVILIGLILAPTAFTNITTALPGVPVGINWLVAAVTIAAIIGFMLFAKGTFKLIPILMGIIIGYALSVGLSFIPGMSGLWSYQPIVDASWFGPPSFIFPPKFSLESIMIIAPVAIVTFVEHMGDINANSAVIGKNLIKDPGVHRTLLGDGLATMFAGLIGGPPNTTYSENTGVLAATRNYNPVTLRIAACFAIALAFFGKFGAVLQTIPGPVLGGISVILFGMITAVGLRTLVENKVDFKNSRNLILAAIMLVTGLGIGSINFTETFEVSGLAIAAILGIILNLILPERLGNPPAEETATRIEVETVTVETIPGTDYEKVTYEEMTIRETTEEEPYKFQ